jgi:hypothetical protein
MQFFPDVTPEQKSAQSYFADALNHGLFEFCDCSQFDRFSVGRHATTADHVLDQRCTAEDLIVATAGLLSPSQACGYRNKMEPPPSKPCRYRGTRVYRWNRIWNLSAPTA